MNSKDKIKFTSQFKLHCLKQNSKHKSTLQIKSNQSKVNFIFDDSNKNDKVLVFPSPPFSLSLSLSWL